MTKNYLHDKRLSFKAKGLLTYLLAHPGCSIDKLELREHATEGSTAIVSALRELKLFGYIRTNYTRSESGKMTGAETKFFETSL